MKLENNRKIDEDELRSIHADCCNWAHYCVNYDNDLADEIIQQTYLKIYEGKASFKNNNFSASLKTWVFSVIRITAYELLRNKSTFNDIELQEGDHFPEENLSENIEAELNYSEAEIESAIYKLTLMQREIIYLVFYKGLSISEIANVLGVSVGAIRTQYHRAKLKFKNSLTAIDDRAYRAFV